MEKRIEQWLEKGLISASQAEALANDCKQEAEKLRKKRSQIALYTIGAILVGLGVITFIAANDWILKIFLMLGDIFKIILLLALTCGIFYGGYILTYERKNFPKLGKAFIVLSSIMIGATYALIGQIYHFNANNSALMFVWLVSVYPMAFIFRDRAINVLSIILFIIGVVFWYMENCGSETDIFFFVPFLIGLFLYCLGNVPILKKNYNEFSLSYKICGLVPIFIMFLILSYMKELSFNGPALLISLVVFIILLAVFNLINYSLESDREDKLFKLETGFIYALLLLLILFIVYPFNEIALKLTANIFCISMIASAFSFGYKFENVRLINLGTAFLVTYLVVRYFEYGWAYLNKSIFFILGGVCLIALGYHLEKKKRDMLKGAQEKSEGGENS